MKNPHVQIVILTHNRPDFLRESLESVLAQTYDNFSVVVSDSSSNEDSYRLFGKSSKYRYVYRGNTESATHVRMVANEIDSEYFMLFHDDDVLTPDFLRETMAILVRYPQAMAIGTNARLLYGTRLSEDRSMRVDNEDEVQVFKDGWDLAKNYIEKNNHGLAPYPSYIYRRGCLAFLSEKLTRTKIRTGDIVFLLRLLNGGPVLNYTKPLMYYRIHGEQDSAAGFSLKEYLAILTQLYEVSVLNCHSPEVAYFRRTSFALWVIRHPREMWGKHARRYWIVLWYLVPYLRSVLFRKIKTHLLRH